MVNATSKWSPTDYAQNAGFVPALGAAALALLDPQPGELILDLGCGDGVLTARVAAAGARVIGLDASPAMVEAARSNGIDAFVADAQALDLPAQERRFGHFDAVFSNAALHWMLNREAVATGVFAVLRAGGRFVGEMGGDGNVATLRRGIREALAARGYGLPSQDPQWYPTVEEFTRLYTLAGFTQIEAERIERPTPLPTGIKGWVKTFRSGWMDVAGVPQAEREEIADAIETRLAPSLRQSDGSFCADYVRLRFKMKKPG